MARRNQNFATLILVIVVGVMLIGTRAETYYVGDTNGWMVPQGGAAAYATWAAQHAFKVGDFLGKVVTFLFDILFSLKLKVH